MRFRQFSGGPLLVWAPAKVNLFLEVSGKRADGYHGLETLLVAVNLYDTLVFQEEPSGEIRFRCDDAALPQGPANLVVRSAQVIREAASCQVRGVSIWLHKRIPTGAGLGGGSSDAAATLWALNRIWQVGWSVGELARLGARIGSDVPFFFHTPMAVGKGRGERLRPMPLAHVIHLVLVCPYQRVSTAEVYGRLSVPRRRRPIEPLLRDLKEGNIKTLGQLLFNRLEPTARRLCPGIAEVQRALRATGLAGPLVTGSGSATFALARGRPEAIRAAKRLQKRFPGRVYVLRSTPE